MLETLVKGDLDVYILIRLKMSLKKVNLKVPRINRHVWKTELLDSLKEMDEVCQDRKRVRLESGVKK